MKIINKDFYLDGGSFVVETDIGTFYQDNSLGSKDKGTWYNAPFKHGNVENKIADLALIKQLEALKWQK